MMVQQREELGLSLSLSLSSPGSSNHDHKLTNNNNQTDQVISSPLDLNLMPSSTSNLLPKNNSHTPHSPGPKMETCRVDRRWSLAGTDVNKSPADMKEEICALTSLSVKKRSLITEEVNCEDVTECSRSDQEDGDYCRKKLRLSKDQTAILEESFKEYNTLNPKQKAALAMKLGLRPRQVEVWFQNRRARTKLKQTEVDCEFLKRCYQTLTEENEKLQKEVQELRAFNKLSPQFSIPPTTLTICPSCEHFGVPPSATTLSVCPATRRAEPPQVHAMSTITTDSISTCGPPTRLNCENQMAWTLYL